MPAWIHNRAEHLLAKNPAMPKGEAFAIATQQAHSVNKSPKGYGTSEGRSTAKAKFDTPKDDKKTANPGGLTSPKMEKKEASMHIATITAFNDELDKIAAGTLGPAGINEAVRAGGLGLSRKNVLMGMMNPKVSPDMVGSIHRAAMSSPQTASNLNQAFANQVKSMGMR